MHSSPFKQFVVIPNFATGHILQWTLDPVFHKEEPYNFTAEVSETADFSNILYSIPAGNGFMAVDGTNIKQARGVDLHYRMKLETKDKSVFYSRPVVFGSSLETRRNYRLASEITRKELLRLTRYTGRKGYLLKRKNFGPELQDDIDPISGVALTDNASDYGTGFAGGYYDPLKIIFTYEDNKQTRSLSESGLGVTEVFDVTFRMIGYPYIETQDIIVDSHTDARFIVKNINSVFFPGTGIILIQSISASFVTSTDPIYQIYV